MVAIMNAATTAITHVAMAITHAAAVTIMHTTIAITHAVTTAITCAAVTSMLYKNTLGVKKAIPSWKHQ